ncbi:4636_t:CDS:2, partial [Ambispora gerdemannii]
EAWEEFQPQSKLTEEKDKYLLEVNLPGDEAKQHYSEIFYGKFYREFALPTQVKKEKVKAHYENEVLTMTVTKDSQGHAHQENNGVDTNVRILPLNFAADGSNIEIVRIYFIMHDENQRQKLDILEEQKTYELSFSDGEVKVNKKDPNLSSKKSGGHFASASSAAGASGPEPEKKGPFVLVNEEKKEIRDSENTAEEEAKSQSTNNTSNF